MKKFLSLVLALVMTMSLVTVSAGAKDFTDDDKITYEEAVNVVSEIGVVDGYADGKFNPTNTLTRQAAAKIICNLILGPTTAAELHADTAPYKDVPTTSEFAGYISYCQKEGIISGYADGTFKPGNTLTGYAFMKMLLGALGYDAVREGYTGGNWSVNVAKQAIGIGLNKSLEGDFNGVKAVTREEACLYAFNTLKADMVEYGNTVLVGDVAIVGGDAKAMEWKNSDTRKTNIKADQYVQFAEQFFPKLILENTTDAFGRPARQWTWKGDEIGTYVNHDLLIETYTEKVTGKTLYELLGKTVVEDYDIDIYIDGETSKDILNYKYTDADKETATNDVYFTAGNIVKTNTDKVGGTGDGVLTEVYRDVDKKEVTIAIINTYLAIADSDYNEKKEEASFDVYDIVDVTDKRDYVKGHAIKDVDVENITVSNDDVAVADIEDGDIVLVTVAEGEIQSVVRPEIISDTEITAFKQGSNLTTDGTKYTYADTAMYDTAVLARYTSGTYINLKDTTYNVILDVYGNAIGVEEVDADDNYVFVTGIDLNTSNLVNKTADVSVIFLDGTMKTVEVNVKKSSEKLFTMTDSVDGQKVTIKNAVNNDEDEVYDGAIVNTWCTYTVNDDGVYTLKIAERQSQEDGGTEAKPVTIDKKHVTRKNAAGNGYVVGNDDTVYLNVTTDIIYNTVSKKFATVVDDVDSVTVGAKNTGIDVIDQGSPENAGSVYSKSEIYTVYDEDNYIIAVVAIGDDKGVSSNYAYVTSKDVKQESYDKTTKDFTWSREVIIDGVKTDITYVSDSIDVIDKDSMDRGSWYKISYYADGTVKKADEITFTPANTDEYIDAVENIEDSFDGSSKDTLVLFDSTVDYLDYENGSLYTDEKQTTGFSVSPSVKVVVVNASGTGKAFDSVEDGYTGYNGLKKAINDLNANFEGDVSAIFEGGLATVIIFNCTAKDDSYNPGKETNESNKYAASLAIQDDKLVLTVAAKQVGVDTSKFDYVVTAEAANGNKVYTIADDSAALAGGADKTDDAAGTAAKAEIEIPASVGSGLMVYTATVELTNGDVLTATLIG